MDSLFEMQRFDPSAEDDPKKVEKIDHSKKLKLKRKIPSDEPGQKEDDGVSKSETEPPKKKKKKNKKKIDPTKIEGFTILGDPTDKSTKKVNRVLPYWLANPDIVKVDLMATAQQVSSMPGLESWMKKRLEKEGITSLFPVQKQVIPHLLQSSRYRPSDVCVSAPTGSGKTLAFVVPVVQSLASRMVPRVRCVAVLPTQELASQVYSVFNTFTAGTGLRVKLLKGGDAVVGEKGLVQRGLGGVIHQLYDILVVTPGRLIHTLRECPSLDLSHLRYLVIDEADRMMENIAHDWLNTLEEKVYTGHRKRPGPLTVVTASVPTIPLQKLLFSATLSHDPEQLEQLNLFEPKLYRCVVPATGDSAQSLPATLSQLYAVVRQEDKPLLLHRVLQQKKLSKTLVFTHSNETVHRLCLLLRQLGHRVGELSSEVSDRRKVLAGLTSGKFSVLVCSDVVARGIDLPDLDGVVSYDVPSFVKTYIHRVGRTARAGREGLAITICQEKQVKTFLKMLRDSSIVGIEQLEVEEDEDDQKKYEEGLEKVKEILTQEKTEKKMAGSDNNQAKKKK